MQESVANVPLYDHEGPSQCANAGFISNKSNNVSLKKFVFIAELIPFHYYM